MKRLLTAALLLLCLIAITLTAVEFATATAPQEETQLYLPIMYKQACFGVMDDFSDPNSGWPIGSESIGFTEYNNGEYRIFVNRPIAIYDVVLPGCVLESYQVEADMRWNGSDNGLFLGVVFSANEASGSYYAFLIRVDRSTYNVYKVDALGATPLFSTNMDSAAINNNGSNKLSATVDNGTYEFRINDTVVTAPTGIPNFNQPTGTGVMAVSADGNFFPADARFDNFSFMPLP